MTRKIRAYRSHDILENFYMTITQNSYCSEDRSQQLTLYRFKNEKQLFTEYLKYFVTYVFNGAGYYLRSCHSGFQTTARFLYGTRRFITMLTNIRYWILFWASSIQSTSSHSIPL